MLNKSSYKIYSNSGQVLKEFSSIQELESSLTILIMDGTENSKGSLERESEKLRKSGPSKVKVILRKQGHRSR
jgi:hypothetical protein